MASRPQCILDFIIPRLNTSRITKLQGEFCVPEHLTGGAAVGDYDNDGFIDVYFTVFHSRSVLYRNNGMLSCHLIFIKFLISSSEIAQTSAECSAIVFSTHTNIFL